ncbi:site-specific DNA-methyltransferase [Francisella tularensis subsp. novicida]|uniref:site-specific DNA-methyltransferase n=1 Tax=Francisella tularensis TaxID=263 RepID=UPI0008FCFA1D|nr:site-specific DNA-methyltransferase [Francisella tularensis]APC95419.1 DNA methylase family protein [Francisella tularensis subsp. novicida]MBK2346728.1 site-specific DNA-methyltransferase [Francisella tularensis subsp. novicida]
MMQKQSLKKETLDGKSMDIVANNIDKLKQIFPDVFSEGQINFEKLQAVLGEHICEDEEHYKFTWHGKKKAEHEATKTRSTGTLRPVKDDSKHWDSTNNIFIEGDNLEVLKLLQKSYHNKIKMIYIDPPYNTGKDFVYKDNYKDNLGNYKKITGQVDGEGMAISSNTDKSGRYHTDWLNMMYPRLKLARNLLKDDGVIFISIDDNEQANLKKMCDEVFGEDNFVGELIWGGKSGSEDDGFIRNNHEYVLCYSKKINSFDVGLDIKEDGIFPFYDELREENYKRQLLRKWGDNSSRDDRPNLFYAIKDDEGKDFFPKLPNGDDGCWRWSNTKMQDAINRNEIEFHINSKGIKEAYEKIYESDVARQTKKFQSLLDSRYSSTSSGTKEVKQLFSDKKVFDRPKPVGLSYNLSKIGNAVNIDDIILDFFAGSGTTGDAVMQLNAEDGGKRKYICVQLDEPISEKDNKEAYNFCTDPKNNFKPVISSITKERLRRAGDKIIADAKKELADLLAKSRPDAEKIKQAQEKLARILGNKEWIPLSSSGMTDSNCHSVAPTTESIEEMLNQVQHDNSLGLDIGFKAFKLDTSNIKPWDGKIENFGDGLFDKVDNIKQSRSTDDVLFEILLKLGLDLTVPITEIDCNGSTLYNIGMGALLICLDSANDAVISEIIKIKNDTENNELEVVFKDSVFDDDIAKTNYSQQLESAGIKTVKVI